MEQHAQRSSFSRRPEVPALLALLWGLLPAFAGASPGSDPVAACRPCHARGAGDQIGEWLASPYSESEGGRGCLDCHDGLCSGTGAAPAPEGRGPGDGPERLREALLLGISTSCSGTTVDVEVAVSNVGAGHRLPSPAGARRLVLEVAARDADRALPFWPAPSHDLSLPPYATEVSRHRFTARRGEPIYVSARLLLVSAGEPPLEIAATATVCISGGASP